MADQSKQPRVAGIALIVVVAAFAAATGGHAATRASSVCPALTGHRWHDSLGKTGTRYKWEVVGRAWTCSSAKPWVLKLVSERAHGTGRIPLHNGPGGYHCVASSLDKNGYAYWGVCYKNTLAYPGSGFSWFGA